MTVREIYAKYQIMPQLRNHMFWVTGVAEMVMDGWKNDVDKSLVIKTCLLHDMGNLAKFNLDVALPGTEPFDSTWKQKQKEFIATYGSNAHEATARICTELGALDVVPVLEDVKKVYESSPTIEELKKVSFATLIVMYADMRVMPKGICSLNERIEDLMRRYQQVFKNFKWTHDFESYLAQKTFTCLEEITDRSMTKTTAEYLDLQILE